MAVEPYLRGEQSLALRRRRSRRGARRRRELDASTAWSSRGTPPFGSLFYLRFVHPLDLAGEHGRARRRRASSRTAAAERVPRRRRPPRARGLAAPARGRALLAVAAPPRQRPGRDSRRGGTEVRADPGAGRRGSSTRAGSSRQSGWTICQYWFFFAYNPWRSGFHGVNDHESDWEMVSSTSTRTTAARARVGRLRLARLPRRRPAPPLGRPRRAGAGGRPPRRLRRGRLARLVLPARRVPGGGADALLASAASGGRRRLGRFWQTTLGQGDEHETAAPHPVRRLRPRRRRRRRPGPAERVDAERHRRDDALGGEYRGLWGLYAQDPISGENAPAGPMYDRDGSPRPSWYDPLGFAGLDRVPPPPREIDALEREQRRLEDRQQRAGAGSSPQETAVLAGARRPPREHARQPAPRVRVAGARSSRWTTRSAKLRDLRKERSENEAVLEGLRRRARAPARRRGRRSACAHHARRRARRAGDAALQRGGRGLGRALDQRSC